MADGTTAKRPCTPQPLPGHAASSGPPVSRRAVLGSGIAMVLPALPAAAAAPQDGTWFLELSRAVTGHADLNATTASRLLAALSALDPDFAERARALARLPAPGMDPEALLAAADAAALKPAMLTIVAAWYTGTVGPGVTGTVVAYADALMYRPITDAIPVQTYCGGGPLWWTAPPPALGVALPEPASAPASGPPVAPAPAGGEGPAPGRQP